MFFRHELMQGFERACCTGFHLEWNDIRFELYDVINFCIPLLS